MKLLIDSKVYAKVMYLVQKCDKEISGLGKVKIEGDTVRVTEMYLLDQECTGTTTDIMPDAVSKLLYQAYGEHGTRDGELLWWWHSHVDMGVFWSGTDMATIREFGGKGRFFATVFNKKAEMRSAYYQAGTTVYPQVFVDAIDTKIDFGLTADEIKAMDVEFTDKVKTKTWKHYGKFNDTTLLGERAAKLAGKKGKKGKTPKPYNSMFNDPFYYDEDDGLWPAHYNEESFWNEAPVQKELHPLANSAIKASNGGKNGNK